MSDQVPHFVQRWGERGDPAINGHLLGAWLRAALKQWQRSDGIEGPDPLITKVYMTDTGLPLFRFMCDGVPFYAVMDPSHGWPVTCYNHAQIRKKKHAKRTKRKARSSRDLGHGKAGNIVTPMHRRKKRGKSWKNTPQ